MANTMALISSVTLASSQANLDFTSIPSTYTDLVLQISGRVDAAGDTPYVQFNGDTAANYTAKRLIGNGSSASSDNWAAAGNGALFPGINGTGQTANTFSSYSIYIPNYAGSTAKSVSVDGVRENNATAGETGFAACLWSGTAAINRITIKLYSASNFVQYTNAYLYGIKNS